MNLRKRIDLKPTDRDVYRLISIRGQTDSNVGQPKKNYTLKMVSDTDVPNQKPKKQHL
jgi:hypothetical protein